MLVKTVLNRCHPLKSFVYGAVRFIGLLGHSAPNFWLGLMGLILFYVTLGWIGGPGRIDLTYEFDLQPGTGFFLLDSAMAGNWEVFGNVFLRHGRKRNHGGSASVGKHDINVTELLARCFDSSLDVGDLANVCADQQGLTVEFFTGCG